MSTSRRAAGASFALAVRLTLAALAALAALAGFAGPAGAHGATGTLGIEVRPGPGPLTASVRVLLEYAGDRDVVTGAEVVASASGPEGLTVAPTPLVDQGQGVYTATLVMPTSGPWTVTVTATDPAATATATVTVGTTPVTTVPATVRLPDTAPDDPADDSPSSGSGGRSPALLAGVAIVVLGAVGAGVVVTRRRRR